MSFVCLFVSLFLVAKFSLLFQHSEQCNYLYEHLPTITIIIMIIKFKKTCFLGVLHVCSCARFQTSKREREREIERDGGRSERKKMKLPSLLSWPTPFDDKDAG